MKILIINNLYSPNGVGGAEISVQKVAESLASRGHDIVVATLHPRQQRKILDVNGVRVHYLPNRNLFFFGEHKQRSTVTKLLWMGLDTYNPFAAAMVGGVLDTEQPDIVNTHNLAGLSPAVWRVAKKRRLPLVHTLRDHNLLCPKSMFRRGRGCRTLCKACRIHSELSSRLSRQVDVVTGASRNVLERFTEYGYFPESEKVVVYNGIEPAPDHNARRSAADGVVRFGFLGRLHPSKGVQALIRSFMELPVGKAKLLIGGICTAEYERELRSTINGHSHIRMLGYVDPAEFFSQVDVSVVPSLCQDCAPRGVLESMAYGLPVIGARRGGIPELMGEGTGWVFDPDLPGDLNQTLQAAIDSPREIAVMRRRASERIKQFSTESMVQGYLKAYACAIDKNN